MKFMTNNNSTLNLNNISSKGRRIVVVDFETTGFKDEDHIIEIGVHELKNWGITMNFFYSLIHPRVKICDYAFKKNRLTIDICDNFRKIMKGDDKNDIIEFLHFINNSIVYVYNSKFEQNFIRKEIEYWGITNIPDIQFRCIMAIAKKMIKKIYPIYSKRDFSLKNVCQIFGIPLINQFKYNTIKYSLDYFHFIHLRTRYLLV